jgi:hypothetical protein
MSDHLPAPVGAPEAPPVTSWRVRGEGIDLRRGASGGFTLRAQVHEAWDAVRVQALPGTPVAEVKQAALHALLGEQTNPADYMVKLHGTELRHEQETLEQVGARAGSTLFMHARRRRPIR